MILIDTNVLVALVDERDGLHGRARRDLKRLKGPFSTTSVVLAETCFLMEPLYLRMRLRALLGRLPIAIAELETGRWDEVFDWLERFADHEPDLCDAMLAVQASHHDARIWSYDKEFVRVWRGVDGAPLAVVPGSRAR